MDFVIGLRGRGNIDAIYKWLSGTGRLITSENTGQYLNATCDDGIDPERAGKRMGKIAVSFRCDPFAYAIANTPLICATSPAIFQTIGTIYSEPVITVTGSGEITLTVNGVALRITGVTGNVTIDVPRRLAYSTDGNGKKTVCLDHTYGNLWDMLLVPDPDAFNRVSWTGNATQVEITKNERWL
jgi:phage-related protein